MRMSFFSLLCLDFKSPEKFRHGVLPTRLFSASIADVVAAARFPTNLGNPLAFAARGPPLPPPTLPLSTPTEGEVSNAVIMLPWFRNLLRRPQNHATSALIVLFLAWKLLLLTIAFLTPGPSYDSSTGLLFQSQPFSRTSQLNINKKSWDFARLAGKLTRWDAIYFTNIGARGRIFEQEWAFGWGWTQLLAELNQSKQKPGGIR